MPLRRRRRDPRARRTALAVSLSGLLAAPVALGSALPAAADHTDLPERVTLMGSLMDELGCPGEWHEGCTLTDLAPGEDGVFSSVFEVPAGSYEFKVRLDGSWEENYGAGGAANGANIPLVLLEDARLRFTYDHDDHVPSVTPVDLAGEELTEADRELASPSLREDLTQERFYFVMADRFENGDPTNDTAGIAGDRTQHGYDPTDKGFYHGGDIQGILDRLDYIEGLGTTAIWLTPSFKNKPVQGVGDELSAGYHGYWVTDFTQIDPHLGTNEELKELIDAAHARGIKVFFDIITNHTADVLGYEDEAYDDRGQVPYVSKEEFPYRDASGMPFDDRDFAFVGDDFPELDVDTSFPYRPVLPAGEEDAKTPGWLNDPTMYHNRGTSTFSGEDALYGDFPSGNRSALDDLFTERPEVVQGMIDIYKTWVEDAGIDGFRIDTVKHVNIEFWQQFGPALEAHAASIGNEDFFMFGEIYDADPRFMSRYTTEGRLQAAVDFGFQGTATAWAKGDRASNLRDFYALDDYYTDSDSNAYSLPTFLGNHDMGRIGFFLAQDVEGDELLERDKLAHSLMYLTRGQPVVYYGDEQGFTGDGGDRDARQDMFPSQVASYNDDDLIGTDATPAQENFDTGHPLYRHISALASLREQHPALADGAQLHRYASDAAGVYAFSRIDRDEKVEYVVATNNSDTPRTVSFPTSTPSQTFQPVWPDEGRALRSGRDGYLTVTVPALSAVVYRAAGPLPADAAAPDPFFRTAPGTPVDDRAEIAVAVPATGVPGGDLNSVTFAWRPVGGEEWQLLGTDDNAPYRVFHDLSAMADGTLLEYRAVVREHDGDLGVAATWGPVGEAPSRGGQVVDTGDVEQPERVTVPGSHNLEMGCEADWAPACPEADLTLDEADQVWTGTKEIPAGNYEYKAAINGSWDENYGMGGARNGSNINYTAPGGPVTYYYDHRTHWVTSDAQVPILTAVGDFQDEIGCAGDDAADCMRSWLQDPDGDGTFTYATTRIPAGTWNVRAAHGLTMDEVYGQGGEQGGQPVPFTVEEEGLVTTFAYSPVSHVLTVTVAPLEREPDLGAEDARLLGQHVVWDLPEDTRGWTYRLHYGADESLSLADQVVTGGRSVELTPVEMPSHLLGAAPGYEGWTALRVPRTAPNVRGLVNAHGQVAVAAYDDLGRVVAASGLAVVR